MVPNFDIGISFLFGYTTVDGRPAKDNLICIEDIYSSR